MKHDTTSETEHRSLPLVEADLPADQFALRETFAAHPGVSFRCEPVVANGAHAIVPLMWAYGADRRTLDRALTTDPSVESASPVVTLDETVLFEVEWDEQVQIVSKLLTNSHATVLDCRGVDGTWTFRLLYPDREALSRTHRFCDDHGLNLDIRSIHEMEGKRAGPFGLTAEQYEALTAAREQGYFRVPREIELHDLADELGISHQALSERLRRARDTLVRGALLSDPPE